MRALAGRLGTGSAGALLALSSALLALSCQAWSELPQPSLPLTPTPDAEFRRLPPEVAPTLLLRAPRPAVAQLANGMKLVVVEDPRQALVSIAFAGRSARSPELDADGAVFSKVALVALLRQAGLDRGVSFGAADDEGTSAELVTDAVSSRSGTFIGLSALPEETAYAAGKLAAALIAPGLEARSLARAKAAVAGPLIERTQESAPLETQAVALLYGAGHPAGRATSDAASFVSRISLAQVAAFHATRYVPEGSALIFVGPITAAQAGQIAEQSFGAWRRPAPVVPTLGLPPAQPGKRLLRLDGSKPGSDLLAIALPCAPASSPDSLELDVLATLLGRVIRSGLARQLRHESGNSYAWSARRIASPDFGTFVFFLETERGKAAIVLQSLLDELKRLSSEPLSTRELSAARMVYLSRTAAVLGSSRSAARALGESFLAREPDDHFATLEARVRAITPAGLQQVARRYFHEAPMAVVAAGQYLDTRGVLAPFGGAPGG